jgi:hypothetical protein
MKKTIYKIGNAMLTKEEKRPLWEMTDDNGGSIYWWENEIGDVINVCLEMLMDWEQPPKGVS